MQKFRIHADPDPQHYQKQQQKMRKVVVVAEIYIFHKVDRVNEA